MLKKYSEELPLTSDNTKMGPSLKTLTAILNYSKSVEPVKTKKEKILVHLN